LTLKALRRPGCPHDSFFSEHFLPTRKSMTHRIVITRTQTVAVYIEAPTASVITDEVIQTALDETVEPGEWTLDGMDHGGPLAVPDADGWPVYRIEGQPAQSLTARAKEIGISIVSLRKWRDERGVDVFDDDQVRAHIARSRNHSFKIAAKFKASLSR
jgi:hypothetical protein